MLRIQSIPKLVVAIMATTLLAIALACASEEEPTTAPTAAPTPTTPAAATPFSAVVQPTATPVDPAMTEDLTWMERYLKSPGYDPAWGEPIRGGTYIFGAQRDGVTFNLESQSCCYTHGCYAGLPSNSLFRIDAWTGDLTTIEGDLVESWDMAEDGLSLTMNLQEGVYFHELHPESPIPAEYNGGQISGDEFVCEDAVATYERFVNPPEWETGMKNESAQLQHLESMDCPDGVRGHTLVMNFSAPLGKTLGILAAGYPRDHSGQGMARVGVRFRGGGKTGHSAERKSRPTSTRCTAPGRLCQPSSIRASAQRSTPTPTTGARVCRSLTGITTW